MVRLISVPWLIATLVMASIVGGTAVAETPSLAGTEPTPTTTCEVVEDDETLEIGVVMQIIAHCQDELTLSEAQRERLHSLRATFIEEALRREARRDAVEDTLAALLRVDREDPGRPVNLVAAEATIRELDGITTDHEIAALRVVEASKAVLTRAQRLKLAVLVTAQREFAALKLDL